MDRQTDRWRERTLIRTLHKRKTYPRLGIELKFIQRHVVRCLYDLVSIHQFTQQSRISQRQKRQGERIYSRKQVDQIQSHFLFCVLITSSIVLSFLLSEFSVSFSDSDLFTSAPLPAILFVLTTLVLDLVLDLTLVCPTSKYYAALLRCYLLQRARAQTSLLLPQVPSK